MSEWRKVKIGELLDLMQMQKCFARSDKLLGQLRKGLGQWQEK